MGLTIIVSGLAGSGKTTLAKRLARRYELNFYTGSSFFKGIAKRIGFEIRGTNWWDTEEGMKFLEKRKENPALDRYVDAVLMKKARRSNVVITSWTLPHLGAPGIKIFLTTAKEERARRIAKRSNTTLDKALKIVDERDKINFDLYKKVYGFDLGRDLKVYDLIVDTTNKTREEVEREVVEFIESKNIKRKI